MIPEIRKKFNSEFRQEWYEAFVKDMHRSNRESLVFRVCETPLFLSDQLSGKLIEAANQIVETFRQPGYSKLVEGAIPPGMRVSNESDHPVFLQVDFAICRDENGEYSPRLIELQGFPSLYCFQHYLDTKIREYFPMPDGFIPFFSGLDTHSYKQLFGDILLKGCAPENVILLEIEPEKQKTRFDFHLTEDYYGIPSVCVTEVVQRGNRLYYKKDGREVPIRRIYHRFIFDELIKKNLKPGFNINDDLDVEWVGHPNWFFKISKFSLPLIKSQYAPQCFFLKDLDNYPDDLENYVLKPLFSFAGSGVVIDLARADLDQIEDRGNFILQRKVEYAPVIETRDIPASAEIRMMFVWDDQPMLVNNLLRTSKGKMMGVDYNKDKTWVGSSLAYHRP